MGERGGEAYNPEKDYPTPEETFDSEEEGGYDRAIRLLPRKKSGGVKGYGQERIEKGRPLNRPIGYSGLKLPPLWYKNLTEEGEFQKTEAFALSSGPRHPLRANTPPSGVLEANIASFSSLAKRRTQALPSRLSRVVQTRYKPGLSKWWRLLRLHFCISWGLPWLRQRRFTNYISQLNNITGLNFIRMCTLSIGFVVKASFLVRPQPPLGDKAFVNGVMVRNPFFQVYKGDRVALLTPSTPSNHR